MIKKKEASGTYYRNRQNGLEKPSISYKVERINVDLFKNKLTFS